MKWLSGLLLILLIVLQYRLWVGQGSLAEVSRLRGEISKQQVLNDRLEVRNKLLESEVLELQQGVDSLEERARSELGMIKKGETYYQLIDPKEPKQQNAEAGQ
jgi:cell division protein FtsB